MKRFLVITLTVLMLMAVMVGCSQKEITDGSYTVEVTLSGGSGRASVESPCMVMIADGQAKWPMEVNLKKVVLGTTLSAE